MMKDWLLTDRDGKKSNIYLLFLLLDCFCISSIFRLQNMDHLFLSIIENNKENRP